MKTELKVTVSNMESKFESLHGKVNEMLVKKAEHMNERISSFFKDQIKMLETKKAEAMNQLGHIRIVERKVDLHDIMR